MEDKMKDEIKEIVKKHKYNYDYKHDYEMDEFEKFMAMSWGTPGGISLILISLAGFIISIGVFFWLLHLANIIH